MRCLLSFRSEFPSPPTAHLTSSPHLSTWREHTSLKRQRTNFFLGGGKGGRGGKFMSQEALKRKVNTFSFQEAMQRSQEKNGDGCSKGDRALLIPPVSYHTNCTCSSGAAGEQPSLRAWCSCSALRCRHQHTRPTACDGVSQACGTTSRPERFHDPLLHRHY